MAKKKLLLNESVTRRFMKLAEINPSYVSNFITEQEEEEMEDMGGEEDLGGEEEDLGDEEEDLGGEEDMDMGDEEMDMEEEGGDAEALVMDLLSKVAEFAEENGVAMNIEGDEEEMDMEGEDEDMDMDMEEEPEEDMGGEEEAEEAPANRMAYNRDMMQESKRALQEADVSLISESDIIDRVVSRVAKRLLRESKQAKQPARRNIRRRRR